MKKYKSSLFNKFELKRNEISSVIGGLYTSAGLDTASTSGYDVEIETLDSSGSLEQLDSHNTGNRDNPRDRPRIN